MTTVLFVILLVWLVGAFISYITVFKDGYDYPLWYSLFWPVMIPLWIIHVIHNAE